jgi:hypothetical protein
MNSCFCREKRTKRLKGRQRHGNPHTPEETPTAQFAKILFHDWYTSKIDDFFT